MPRPLIQVVSARSQVRLIGLALVAALASCADHEPGAVASPELPNLPQRQMSALICTGNSGTRTVECAPAGLVSDAAAAVRGSASLEGRGLRTASSDPGAGDPALIIGGQGVNVTLASNAITYTPADSMFSFDVTVRNHIGQPLGTTDGTTLHPMGVRVFFQQLPVAVGGAGGPFAVQGDGTATFTSADQPYYQFDSIIEDEQVSASRRFSFKIPPETNFRFQVLVWAPVQWPDGWVAVTPATDTLNMSVPGDQSVALIGKVYSRVGVEMTETITWGSSDPNVAIVEPDGLVTGLRMGTAIITGSAAGRASGSATIVVIQPADLTKSTIATAASTVTADGTSTTTVTVQLKDGLGQNLTNDAGTVVLSNSGAGTLGTVTYAGNGAYTATLTAPTVAGQDTITATLDGNAILDTAVVGYTPGTPAQLTIKTQPSSTAETGATLAQQPVVQLRDAHGNAVSQAGVSVTAAIASGGGTLGGTATVSTDASGTATFTDLRITGTVGSRTLSFSTSGLTAATSNAIDVQHGALHHFLVEPTGGGAIANQLAGTAFNVRVTAQDDQNNTVTSFTGTVSFTSTPGGGISAGASSGAFTGGVLGSHSITFGTSGTFRLSATRAGGTETGTSGSFEVQAPPSAVNEGPAGNSAPGQAFHAFYSTAGSAQTFTLSAPGVLSNDNLGFPAATVTSFGADSVGGSVTTYAAGSTVSPLPGTGRTTGSLTVNADGSITFTPPDGFTGYYVFRYRLTNVRGTSDGQVTIAVGTRPVATNDTYTTTLLGNVPINTATSTQFRVTSNDQGDGKILAITGQSNGNATLNADSTFSFRPTPGYEGPASFTYTVKNGFGTSAPATVSMNVSGMVWFINGGAAAGGDGRFDSPFNSLSAFQALNNGTGNNPAASDRIFLYSGTYSGPVTLLSQQQLIGQGASGTFATATGLTWPADAGSQPSVQGTRPTITASGVNAVALNAVNTGNTLSGFNIGNVGAAGTGIHGSSFGTLTVSDVGINTDGRALNLSGGTLAGDFSQVRSTGGANNITLTNVGTAGSNRTLGTSADALSGASSDAVRIDGGNGSFTYAGSIANTTSLAVNITGKNGGTVTLSGDLNPSAAARGISIGSNSNGTTINFTGANQKISTGTGAGVSLTSNTGSTVNFTGGALAIATTTGAGFNVTGGGTVAVTGANNTISSAGGVALNVANTTIEASGLNFRSISANGGSNGIVLNNTGSTGRLQVTGTGTAGSGGTIQNATGDGISLTSTINPSFTQMIISGNDGNGIGATTVSGLSLSSLQVLNNTDALVEAGILLTNLTGTNTINATEVSGSTEDNVRVINNTGTLNSLTISSCTIRNNSTASGNVGINVQANNSAVMTVSVTNCVLNGNRTVSLRADAAGTAQLNYTATNNVITGGTGGANQGNQGIEVSASADAQVTYDVSGNKVGTDGVTNRPLGNTGINLFGGNRSTLSGKVSSNTVHNAGAGISGFGIRAFSNDTATIRANINGNTVRNVGLDYGVLVEASGADTQVPPVGRGRIDAALTGNNVSVLSGALDAIRAQARHNNTVCARISNNTAPAGGSGFFGLVVRQANAATFNLEGLALGAQSGPTTKSYLQTQNPSASVDYLVVTNFTGVANNACNIPN